MYRTDKPTAQYITYTSHPPNEPTYTATVIDPQAQTQARPSAVVDSLDLFRPVLVARSPTSMCTKDKFSNNVTTKRDQMQQIYYQIPTSAFGFAFQIDSIDCNLRQATFSPLIHSNFFHFAS